MKQTIEYYYNIKIDQLFIEDGAYHFILNKEDYYFIPYLHDAKSINDVIDYSRYLKEQHIDCHDILLNIKKEPLTTIDEVSYLLMKARDKDREYHIFDIEDLQKKVNIDYNSYHNNWAYLWSKKIDYIENQISEIKVDNIINMSVDYYIGLAENAIYYVNTINEEYTHDHPCLCHKRIYYPNTKLNFMNPISFILDIEVRDIAEYLKSMFWYGEDAFTDLSSYLKSKRLTPYLYNMLFARLIYPSYYFDIYEKVVNSKENSEQMIKYLDGSNRYETFLKKAYKEISLYANLLTIDWLIY